MTGAHTRRTLSQRAVIMFLMLLLVLEGCDAGAQSSPTAQTSGSQSTQTSQPGTGARLSVVATTTQIRSMTEFVAGDFANVRSILTPGADPHEYEPRPSDVAAIARASLVLRTVLAWTTDWKRLSRMQEGKPRS